MPFLPTISTVFIVISAILVAIGWTFIAKGKATAHRRTMIAAAISALTFFILYVSRTIFLGNQTFGGPEDMQIYYTSFLIFHIFLATTGAVFGLITLYLAFKRRISKHRKIGPVTAVIWFFTAITGVIVYLLLYILYDGGHSTSLFRAIFGG
ncbi:putative membrane protein [Alkalibacillus flavidus]|uniref:Membrane protein n=1 Tax=Alkalibacillus flavidus TaxID=546021 RepID=A0ABV2KTL8_9BACI